MKASELVEGKLYEVEGERVEFAYIGATGLAIVHPPGEPDMQSSWGVDPSLLEEVGRRTPPRKVPATWHSHILGEDPF